MCNVARDLCVMAKIKNNKISDLATPKTIYHSLIQSHLSYGVHTYGGTFKQNLEKNYNNTWPQTFRNCQAFIYRAQYFNSL